MGLLSLRMGGVVSVDNAAPYFSEIDHLHLELARYKARASYMQKFMIWESERNSYIFYVHVLSWVILILIFSYLAFRSTRIVLSLRNLPVIDFYGELDRVFRRWLLPVVLVSFVPVIVFLVVNFLDMPIDQVLSRLGLFTHCSWGVWGCL